MEGELTSEIDFNEHDLALVLKAISSLTGWLLEIVNFNVADSQYVCAGEVIIHCQKNHNAGY